MGEEPVDFFDVAVGETVHRLFAGVVPMDLRVTTVTADLIICGDDGGWTFDRATGIEEDYELGWGVSFGTTGSFLVKEYPSNVDTSNMGEVVGRAPIPDSLKDTVIE